MMVRAVSAVRMRNVKKHQRKVISELRNLRKTTMHLIWRRIGQGRKGETHPPGTSAYGIRVLKMIDPRWLEEESLDLQGQGLFLSEVASLTRNAGGDPSFEYHVRPCTCCEIVLEVQGWLVGKID